MKTERPEKLVSKLHAIINHKGVTHLKKNDLKFSTRRYELVGYYLARDNTAYII